MPTVVTRARMVTAHTVQSVKIEIIMEAWHQNPEDAEAYISISLRSTVQKLVNSAKTTESLD